MNFERERAGEEGRERKAVREGQVEGEEGREGAVDD